MARYGEAAQKSVERAMHKRKRGKLESGRSGKKVKSRKQAIAIGLSEAREKGAKVPSPRGSKRSTSKRASKRSSSKRSSKRTTKRSTSKRTGKRSSSKKK